MKLAFSIIVAAFLIAGCASMGTTQKIANRAALDSVRCVGIGPYKFNKAALVVIDSIYAMFDSTLLGGLRHSGVFQTIIPWDTLKVGINLNADSASQLLFQKAADAKLDAIMLCDLNIFNSSYMFVPIHDAEVILRLYRVSDGSLIITNRFSTKSGKSYMWPPDHKTVTKDATEAAIEALRDVIKKGT